MDGQSRERAGARYDDSPPAGTRGRMAGMASRERVFDCSITTAAVTRLPRSEQRRILSVLEALVAQASHGNSSRAA
ncbi:MAG: hypothetical protein AMXMBFR34_43400 [Myxococcaceae bacterium]